MVAMVPNSWVEDVLVFMAENIGISRKSSGYLVLLLLLVVFWGL